MRPVPAPFPNGSGVEVRKSSSSTTLEVAQARAWETIGTLERSRSEPTWVAPPAPTPLPF